MIGYKLINCLIRAEGMNKSFALYSIFLMKSVKYVQNIPILSHSKNLYSGLEIKLENKDFLSFISFDQNPVQSMSVWIRYISGRCIWEGFNKKKKKSGKIPTHR